MACAFDQEIQERNQGFATLEGEALRTDEFLLHEVFEYRGVGQLGQDADLARWTESHVVACGFHALLQPVPHREVIDMHELHTH